MLKIDAEILKIDKVISASISKFDDSERGLLSQIILAQLRNFVEYISIKIYGAGQDLDLNYPNIKAANAYVRSRAAYKFLNKFYDFLEISASHYTLDEENSERLMLKYYEYLLRIKSLLKNTYNLEVLQNIDEFPIDLDPALKEYYEKIVLKLNAPQSEASKTVFASRYYVQKIKPFFINLEVYFEVTLTTANDNVSKFDRIIAFTKHDMQPNYAVWLTLSDDTIEVMGKRMPIQIIDDWEVSIRPCELNHFADLFGNHTKIQSTTLEYKELMDFLKKTGLNLVEIVTFSDAYYQRFREVMTTRAQTTHILDFMDQSRKLITNDRAGSNVLRYLLFKLNNKIIKSQYSSEKCELQSGLRLEYGCIPFDEMPYASALLDHNPKLTDLFDCISPSNREYELFARLIKKNTESRGKLYTSIEEIHGFENIDDLINAYNNRLYRKHGDRKLEKFKDFVYIKEYEQATLEIVKKLKELSLSGIKNYSASFDSWVSTTTHVIDSPEKKEKLRIMFESSTVALIYGAAGTGKSTLINHLSHFFNDKRKLYLANTNPAVDNLRRRVSAANTRFMTVASFLAYRNHETEFDVLIIDECSTVSNRDMLEVIRKASYTLLVLVGDIYQIEAIRFGNWFCIAKDFVPDASVFELTKPYRSTNDQLLTLWDKVRNIDDDILEQITRNEYAVSLDGSIFDQAHTDEIILCLNYDGLYGINNINRFLQGNNPNPPKRWRVQTYKVNDPVLFNETERFAPLIYNNLKGKIAGIEIFNDKVQFDIELDRILTEVDIMGLDLELIENSHKQKTIIRFFVKKQNDTDDDDESSIDTVVPFQVAYAVSIHKAQGLEYDSVKIVITDEIEERITHNIFYTAITRAKDKLKIYWSPEIEGRILKSLVKKDPGKDALLLAAKYNI